MLSARTLLQERYMVVRLIGHGGMGAVYEAHDTRLNTLVALKQTTLGGDRAGRAFEREAHRLASLRHPSLPKVIDYFIDQSGQYLVMEYIPGDDLGISLEQRGAPFTVQQVMPWAAQLLRVLEYLHCHQPPVLHRDIKPQNLKLTATGDLVLLDFGLAKSASLLSRVTTGGSVTGYTPFYAPLEQIHGTATDERSDLYAAAATLHHLLTGLRPIDALTRAAAMLRGMPDPLIAVADLNPRIPAGVSAALSQTLSLNPEDRPANAAALRLLLDHARFATPATPDEWVAAARRVDMEPVRVSVAPPSIVAPAKADRAVERHPLRIQVAEPGRVDPADVTLAAPDVVQRADIIPTVLFSATANQPIVASPSIRQYRRVPRMLVATLIVGILIAIAVAGWRFRDEPPAVARPTPRPAAVVVAEPEPTAQPVLLPIVDLIEPAAAHVSVLPLTVILTGNDLDLADTFAFIGENGRRLKVSILSLAPSRVELVIHQPDPPLSDTGLYQLVIDGAVQTEGLLLRDYLDRRQVAGVLADYTGTGRVFIDAAGAYTTLQQQPDVRSERVVVVRAEQLVEILRDDHAGWYLVRYVPASEQPPAIGWIERWLVDNTNVPQQRLLSGHRALSNW